jgi:hypothetical protein
LFFVAYLNLLDIGVFLLQEFVPLIISSANR